MAMKRLGKAYSHCLIFLVIILPLPLRASDSTVSWIPKIGGTLRAKYEYQTDVATSRFQVRDARVNVKGWMSSFFDYKLELNLSDKGKIRTHDLYGRVHFGNVAKITAGQFRVPISVDAARSPHLRLFANRSFVGKQIGNVFDIGVKGTFSVPSVPLTAEFGVFNGKGSSTGDDEWQSHFLYVGHLKYEVSGLTANLSGMTTKPERVRMNLYDLTLTYESSRFMVEGEYLYKHYAGRLAAPVHSCNVMASYALPLESRYADNLRFLGRFDMMTDNSSGTADSQGQLVVDDIGRKRATVGVTLGYYRKVAAELRVNFEKYFYGSDAEIGVSDHDKIVAELMFNF